MVSEPKVKQGGVAWPLSGSSHTFPCCCAIWSHKQKCAGGNYCRLHEIIGGIKIIFSMCHKTHKGGGKSIWPAPSVSLKAGGLDKCNARDCEMTSLQLSTSVLPPTLLFRLETHVHSGPHPE